MPGRSRSAGASTGSVVVGLTVNVDRATVEFRQIRRDADQRLREALRVAGEKDVLPHAKALAGRLAVTDARGGKIRTAATLTVKTTAREARLTTTAGGRIGRAIGLQEFGGTVSGTILPKRKQALTVNGQPVANVKGARHYHPHRFMVGAVDQGLDSFTGTLLAETMRLFHDFT